MTPLSEIKCLIFDYGNYLSLAERLGRLDGFQKVYYYTTKIFNGFPDHRPLDIGRNVPNVEIVEEWASVIDEVDIVVFPDSHEPALQTYFESIGKKVFGSKYGCEIEHNRGMAKQMMKEIGLPVNDYEEANGMTELENILKQKENVFVKSSLRGDLETFHHENYMLSKAELLRMRNHMGTYAEKEKYIVETPIDSVGEIGIDTFCIDGNYPMDTLSGIEIKDCYDKETEILTDEGWKLFKDLNKKEKVFTLDISDSRHIRAEYKKPTDYIEKEFNGELVCIEKDSVSLRITPRHKVLVQDGIQNENAEEVEWEKLGEGRIVVGTNKFKRGKRVLRLQRIQDLINRGKRFSLLQPKFLYVANTEDRNWIDVGSKRIRKRHLAEILGMYLSEGSIKRKLKKRTNEYYYCINIAQFKYVDEFSKMLEGSPYKWTRSKNGFYCYDKELGEYLYQFGLAKDKYVPQWIKECGKSLINSFLNAYCLGDGTFNFNYKKIRKDSTIYNENYTHKVLTSRYFYTSSKKMADDLQELLIKVGSVCIMRVDKKYYNNSSKEWRLMYGVQEKLINRKNYVFPKDIEYVQYNDKIYCVTVPSGIIMVRRNGKEMWCGNSAYYGQIVPYHVLPRQLRNVTDKFAPIFTDLKYRGSYSNEVIISPDKQGYLIDTTARCFSSDTEILTDKGWKFFYELDGTEKVCTLNPHNRNIEYQNPTNYISNFYEGNMILFTNGDNSINSLVTPNHAVWRTDRHRGKLFEQRADSLTDKGFIPRVGKWEVPDVEYFEIPEYHHEWDFIGGNKKQNRTHFVCTKVKHENAINIKMDYWIAFLAWFLTEGSIGGGKNSKGIKESIKISQKKCVKELMEVLDNCGFKYKYNSGIGFQINSVQLSQYLQPFGKKEERYVPDYIKKLSSRQIRIFLDNYMLAYGSIDRGKYFTISKKMVDDLQELIMKAGSVANFKLINNIGTKVIIKGKEYTRKFNIYVIQEYLNRSDYWFETKSRKDRYIKDEPYKGLVYDVTVPNHIVYVRRNGKPLFSGNCPQPPTDLMMEMISNYPEVIWQVANGIVPVIQYIYKHGIQLIIKSDLAKTEPSPLIIPDEYKRFVKVKNLVIDDEGIYWYTPMNIEMSEIASVVGLGSSIYDALDMAKKIAESIKGFDIKINTDCIEDAMEQIRNLKKIGINYLS